MASRSSPALSLGGLVARLAAFGLLTAILALAAGFLLPGSGLVAGAAILGAAAFAAGAAMLRHDGRSIGSLGLVPDRRAVWETGTGWLLGLGVAGVAMGVLTGLGGLRFAPDGTPWTWTGWAFEGARSLAWLAVPAAAEEVLVRGYPLVVAAAAVGPGGAVWITAGAFGVLHAANPGASAGGVAGTAAAGLFLGALVVRSGSLWPAIGAHLGWNWALAFLGDVPLSGLEVADAPGFDGSPAGAAWLGGGDFGVEASVVVVGMLVVAAGAVWWRAGAPGRTFGSE